MSRKFLSLFLSSILLAACSNVKNKSFLQEENIKGKVKKYTEANYFTGDDSKEKLTFIEEHSIDRDGNRTMVEDFSPEKKFTGRCIFEHDDHGNVTALTNYDENEKEKSSSKLKYDEHNNLIEYWGSNFKDITDKHSYKYDEKGNAIEEIYYGQDGGVYSKDLNTFDEKGNLIKDIEYREGKLHLTISYKYDSTGNKIERKDLKPDGSIDRYDTWKYDNKNNLIEEIEYDWQGLPYSKTKYIYESYDAEGNWLVQKKIVDDIEKSKKVRTYEYY